MLRYPLIVLSSAALFACGGTSGQIDTDDAGLSESGDTTLQVSLVENTATVRRFSAAEASDAIDFSLDVNAVNSVVFSVVGGEDEALFTIAQNINNDHLLLFNSPPDFESPGDADQDNVYELEVRGASPTASTTLEMQVTVTDAATITANATATLNDTGITLCGDFSPAATHNNDVDCISGGATDPDGDTPSPQDAHVGRDNMSLASPSSLTKVGEGDGGFDFTKLNAQGEVLSSNASSWACVKDNVTGLIWEARDDTDLQDETEATMHIADVNAASLCGSDQWRLPNHSELLGLLDYSVSTAPLTSSQFFSDTQTNAAYRTAPPSSATQVWTVSFNDASLSSQVRTLSLAIRLVHGE